MADVADRSWNYPNIFTGGAIGLGRFGFPCLRVDRPLKSDLSFDDQRTCCIGQVAFQTTYAIVLFGMLNGHNTRKPIGLRRRRTNGASR
jgi:hypothetical protein